MLVICQNIGGGMDLSKNVYSQLLKKKKNQNPDFKLQKLIKFCFQLFNSSKLYYLYFTNMLLE